MKTKCSKCGAINTPDIDEDRPLYGVNCWQCGASLDTPPRWPSIPNNDDDDTPIPF